MRGKPTEKRVSKLQNGITPAGAGKTYRSDDFRQCAEDHPRRCGENLTTSPQNSASAGSPPQVRGKPTEAADRPESWRITPAGAGKTRCDAARSAVPEDHPRRCGENSARHCQQRVRKGSPPQVRGKPRSSIFSSWILGITPAGAGKTCRLRL